MSWFWFPYILFLLFSRDSIILLRRVTYTEKILNISQNVLPDFNIIPQISLVVLAVLSHAAALSVAQTSDAKPKDPSPTSKRELQEGNFGDRKPKDIAPKFGKYLLIHVHDMIPMLWRRCIFLKSFWNHIFIINIFIVRIFLVYLNNLNYKLNKDVSMF